MDDIEIWADDDPRWQDDDELWRYSIQLRHVIEHAEDERYELEEKLQPILARVLKSMIAMLSVRGDGEAKMTDQEYKKMRDLAKTLSYPLYVRILAMVAVVLVVVGRHG